MTEKYCVNEAIELLLDLKFGLSDIEISEEGEDTYC